MKNVKTLEFNAYCTGDNGKNYRVVSIAGEWYLCEQDEKMPTNWNFVRQQPYSTMYEALSAVDALK